VYGDRPHETVRLNTSVAGWRSAKGVLCHDFSFRLLYDANQRAVIVRGTVRRSYSWLLLEDCQAVVDATGLTASTLSGSGGLQRISVTSDQIRMAPNQGVTMAQIEGVSQSTALRYDAQTMSFVPDGSTFLQLEDSLMRLHARRANEAGYGFTVQHLLVGRCRVPRLSGDQRLGLLTSEGGARARPRRSLGHYTDHGFRNGGHPTSDALKYREGRPYSCRVDNASAPGRRVPIAC